jgi:hypothetical protein
LTDCPRPVRALGYLRESLAIRACHRRCCYAWASHLRRTQDVIRAAVQRCAQRRKAVIVGSGMLHDVPLDELAEAFHEVILVDIIHLPGARRRLRAFPNVRPVCADVTGAVAEVYRVAHQPNLPLPRIAPDLFCADAEVDLVASVNLLPQIPYLPTRYLLKAGAHGTEAIARFGRSLVEAHLDWLRRLPGVVALIADVEEIRVNRAGEELDRVSTVCAVEVPWTGSHWTWRLEPAVERSSGVGRHRHVIGVVDVKSAPARSALDHTFGEA